MAKSDTILGRASNRTRFKWTRSRGRFFTVSVYDTRYGQRRYTIRFSRARRLGRASSTASG